ncbi:hypothetical protein SHKM778_82930 [Streptomyces sp. KM77-8]|uniref:Uncharacterized protein n=1 Tax=Streptomyces haneummycinicus TaxID=3074435 RepID=A0AAT9HWT7_9ACTN
MPCWRRRSPRAGRRRWRRRRRFLLLEEFAGAGDGVGGADGEAGGEDGGVVQLGDEALVEVAQAVDEVVVARFGGDDPDVGLVLAQIAADAHEGAGGAEAGHEVGDGRQVGEDLGAGGRVVGAGVVRVAVLVEHDPVGVLGGEFLGDAYGGVGAAGGRGGMISAPHMRSRSRRSCEVFSGITQTMR